MGNDDPKLSEVRDSNHPTFVEWIIGTPVIAAICYVIGLFDWGDVGSLVFALIVTAFLTYGFLEQRSVAFLEWFGTWLGNRGLNPRIPAVYVVVVTLTVLVLSAAFCAWIISGKYRTWP